MRRYVAISVLSGLLFGALDGVIHANPLAIRLYAVYQPIARTSIDVAAGVCIDLVYGFALAGLYLLLSPSLPGASGPAKGLGFGAVVWFLRVVMSAASTWMMFTVPEATLAYEVVAGLAELLALGLVYGLTLRPASR